MSSSESKFTTATQTSDKDEATVQSFVDALPGNEKQSLEWELQSFVVKHASHHRPIALVSSGGTVADLEIHSVRCLDNFSTGLRGAVAVEQFLKRGYAVIHLWREGSASPYGRILSQTMGIKAPNQGITMGSLGKLFATGDLEEDQEEQLVQTVLDEAQKNDPWLSDPSHVSGSHGNNNSSSNATPERSNTKKSLAHAAMQLHRRINNSTLLRTALLERQLALEDGRILTIPFRSVDDYLAKLQLSAMHLRGSQALAIFFLAAAVSDFYVPLAERSTHKIQSRELNNGTTLKLWPVPKVMGLLHTKWAPDSFVCSFKLETDKTLLRQKAEGSIEKYGCHMVIGNLLETRHSQVWVLAPPSMDICMNEQIHKDTASAVGWNVKDWPMHEISKSKSSGSDDLEALMMDYVVQAHFDYISVSSSGSFDRSGTTAILRAHEELERKRKLIEREAFWNKVQKVALEWTGVALGAAISYLVSAALKRRMNP